MFLTFDMLRLTSVDTHEFLLWVSLINAANFAAVALWKYLEDPPRRALAASFACFSVFYLTMFFEYRPAASDHVLAWAGFVAAVVGVIFMYIDKPELYTK